MSDLKRTVGPVTAASAAAAAVSTVLFWCIQTFTGVDVPAEVQGAVTVLFTLAGGYLVKPGAGKRKADAPAQLWSPGDTPGYEPAEVSDIKDQISDLLGQNYGGHDEDPAIDSIAAADEIVNDLIRQKIIEIPR